MDLEKGLHKAIQLNLGGWIHTQIVDYVQIPLKCNICHTYRHFAQNCPKKQVKAVIPEQSKKQEERFHLVSKRKKNSKEKHQPSNIEVKESPLSKNRFATLAVEKDLQDASQPSLENTALHVVRVLENEKTVAKKEASPIPFGGRENVASNTEEE